MAQEDTEPGGDDQLDSGTLAQMFGGLYGPASAEAQKQALGILKAHQTELAAGVQPEDEIVGKMKQSADDVRAALKDARMRLINRGNDKTEALLAISAGLGRPTRFGTIGEAMGNMSEALQPVVHNQESREKELLGIDESSAGVENTVNAAELQLAELKRRLGSAEAIKALEVLRGSRNAPGMSRDIKIRDYMTQFIQGGMEPNAAWDRAVKVVDGKLKIEAVPGLGVVRLLDTVNGTAEEIPITPRNPKNFPGGGGAPGSSTAAPDGTAAPPAASPGDPASAQSPQRKPGPASAQQGKTPGGEPSNDPRDVLKPGEMTMYDAAGLGTGFWSDIRQGYSAVAGNVGLPVAGKTAEARQTLVNQAHFMSDMLTLDPKDPSYNEVKDVKNSLDLLPTMGNNPPMMRTAINTLDKNLRGIYDRANRDANDTTLPQDFRSKRASLAASIRSFIPVLGAREKPGDAVVPVGIPPDVAKVWQYMSPEGRALAEKKYGR